MNKSRIEFLEMLRFKSGLLERLISLECPERTQPIEECYRVMVIGDCPACGSERTNDLFFTDQRGKSLRPCDIGICGNDECGLKWCLECGMPKLKRHTFWEHNAFCTIACKDDDNIKRTGCPYDLNVWECSKVPGGIYIVMPKTERRQRESLQITRNEVFHCLC